MTLPTPFPDREGVNTGRRRGAGSARWGGRTPRLTRAREGLAYCWIEGLGRPARLLAAVLGVRPQSVYLAAQRGREAEAEWRKLLVG